MKFSQENAAGLLIHGYGPGEITISAPTLPQITAQGSAAVIHHLDGRYTFTTSLLIGSEDLLDIWAPQSFEELETTHFAPLLALEPDLVLLGSGGKLRFPDPAVIALFHQQGIGLEIMDTPAACRTFNILLGEGRRVAAGLLKIDED